MQELPINCLPKPVSRICVAYDNMHRFFHGIEITPYRKSCTSTIIRKLVKKKKKLYYSLAFSLLKPLSLWVVAWELAL